MAFTEYSSLIDTALVLGLALVVWGAYRELRRRKRAADQASQISNSRVA